MNHVASKTAWDLLRTELHARHVAMALRLQLKVGFTPSCNDLSPSVAPA